MPTGVYVRTAEHYSYMRGNNRTLRHGHTTRVVVSPTYHSWRAMVNRCTDPSNDSYKYYSARGVTIAPSWNIPKGRGIPNLGFTNFLADMGERPAGTTLDRITNDGNYEPSNCRWATPKAQAQNRRKPGIDMRTT